MDQPLSRNTTSTANYLLEGLLEIGVEYIFCNLGTDHTPIIEELARWELDGRQAPKIILCPHENTAIHMAAGYAMMTGRGQGVLVHVDSGTANAAMGVIALARGNIPAILMAGKAPFTTFNELPGSKDHPIHFIQDPADQASIVRPYVKWEYTLASGVNTKEVLRRAHSVMQSQPQGPVYLMLPRETLSERWPPSSVSSFPAERFTPVTGGAADLETAQAIAARLLEAQHPILITGYGGKNPSASRAIDRLGELCGIRIFDANSTMNISRTSAGFSGFAAGEHLAKADVGLLVDVDVPFVPSQAKQNDRTFWAQIDIDPLKRLSVLWSFPTDIRIAGDSGRVLNQIADLIEGKANAAFGDAVKKRLAAITAERAASEKRAAGLASDPGTRGAINSHFICAELGRQIGPDDIVLNEGISNGPVVALQIPRSKPGTMIRAAGGGLGSSGGFALGARLARPDALAIQIVGDGCFYFNNPLSMYGVARLYNLPVFTLILDNSGWASVRDSTVQGYPDGAAKQSNSFQSRLDTGIDFSKLADVVDAYGEKITDPANVSSAISRGLDAVRAGRSAILHAVIRTEL